MSHNAEGSSEPNFKLCAECIIVSNCNYFFLCSINIWFSYNGEHLGTYDRHNGSARQ
jgi:hypothetical protein